ncbi:MAG: uroporphyrinogen-III C-methyltransferase [Betaproteobacteria bacterium]|nr:uroporphyrinogen-III C-methyltransferase [Betaproteobacteria bacterium]
MISQSSIPAFPHVSFNAGEVALIGAGPGDPGLLTIRAWSLLQQAEAVVYDRLVSEQLLVLLPADCKLYYTGKSSGYHTLPQEEINALLGRLALEKLRVVRLKGGDPFVFGRGAEEVDYLLGIGVNCQIVPGITAAIGCTTYAGIPLTHRDLAHSCQFITGHMRENGELCLPWEVFSCENQTLVFYMGLANLAEISSRLIKAGLPADTPAALINKGASPEQKVARGTLASLHTISQTHDMTPPTLIVIGKVVALFSDASIQYPARMLADRQEATEAVCAERLG